MPEGLAEYPSISLSVFDLSFKKKVMGSEFEVELADAPNPQGVVKSFTEKSDGNQVVFLAPYPLRKNIKEFETGRQMAQRRAKWAKEAVGDDPIELDKFEVVTSFYSPYDPAIQKKRRILTKIAWFQHFAGGGC